MTKKNRYLMMVLLGAVMALGIFVVSHRSILAQGGVSEPEVSVSGNGGGVHSLVALTQANRGIPFFTAAINADGTLASCFSCVPSKVKHLATGEYQVGFSQTVTATNGWSRWVQVDTLTINSINNVTCSTADRDGLPSGVFVDCYDGTGANVDTSFFLFVAR